MVIDILQDLRQDHINVGRVLTIAEQAIDAIAAGNSTDYDLLEDVMRYVTGYSDVHHHPTEDVVYEQLKRCSPDAASKVDAITAEHDVLIQKGRAFLELVEAVEGEAMVRRDQFVRVGREYLSALGRHMGVEERELFPLAAAALSPAAWVEVGALVGAQPDPLFGPSIDEEYRRIWERIQAHTAER